MINVTVNDTLARIAAAKGIVFTHFDGDEHRLYYYLGGRYRASPLCPAVEWIRKELAPWNQDQPRQPRQLPASNLLASSTTPGANSSPSRKEPNHAVPS